MKVQRQGDTFIAYADGSAIGQTGKGGWGVVVFIDGKPFEMSGSARDATNNRMELQAAISALEALPDDAAGVIRTDSNYVVKGLCEWRDGWKKRGWRNAKNDPLPNLDLWMKLFEIRDRHKKVRFEWVKGHASDPGNIRVDAMALREARSVR